MKKAGKKEVFVTVVVLSVAVLVLVYMFVYKKYNEKTAAMVAQNSTLRTQVNDMKQYYDLKPQYEQWMTDMQVLIDEIIEEYPADAKEEDALMLAVDMQAESNLEFERINLPAPEQIYVIAQADVAGANIETLQDEITFSGRDATYSCVMGYEDLKSVIGQIYENPNRIAIRKVNLMKNTYDVAVEDGAEEKVKCSNLKGDISIVMYTMTGTGKTYEAPEMAEYAAGTTNPFGLVDFGVELEAEE